MHDPNDVGDVTQTNRHDQPMDLAQLLDLPPHLRLRAEERLVADLVDPAYYVQTSGHLMREGEEPVAHFCRIGWRLLRKPRPGFDVWWYWVNHLDPSSEDVNPLVHYALVGRDADLSTRPVDPRPRPGDALPTDRPLRRACLFAAFDAEGVVDESTALLIAELSRHSDVFVLYDNFVAPAELAKLDGITAGAWAIRHGAYDFGSYSMLARDLVGWERLAEYDEVLLVNDSCFLIRPLDDVFARMGSRPCDWWGLQATKGLASTRERASNSFTEPIPIERVRSEMLDGFEEDPVYDFHVGSYFLAFRRSVIEEPRFRALLDSVGAATSKLLVILKYEIGLTHLLVGNGYRFDTFVPTLDPFHPLFTLRHFELLAEGFPLLKRYLLSQNHYDMPGIDRWPELVRSIAPEAPVELFEQSLRRTAPDDLLQRNATIQRKDDGSVRVPRVLRGRAYHRRDAEVDKHADVWAFAVDPASHRLPDNSRALFEAVKDDPAITKVILTRSKRLGLTGANVLVEPVMSPAGRKHLLRAGRVFINARAQAALQAPVTAERQLVVAVRDGLILQRHGRAAAAQSPRPGEDAGGLVHPPPETQLSGLLVASDVDALAAVACTWPATYGQAWRTGIPAHDFLFAAEEALPDDIGTQVRRLRGELAGRRLLLFAPSVRRSGTSAEPYRFTPSEVAWLRAWTDRHGIALGVREYAMDLERPYTAQLGAFALDLSWLRYPSVHAVLRSSDYLLTDYADVALDFAVTGRPVVSFTHDYDVAQERLLYELDHFFPGPVVRSFQALEGALESLPSQQHDARHDRVRTMLTDYRDDQNTARALARMESIA